MPDLATKIWVVLLLFGLLVPRNELGQLQMAIFGKISPLAYQDILDHPQTKCLICKGQYSPSSAGMYCARAVCAKKQCSEFVLVI